MSTAEDCDTVDKTLETGSSDEDSWESFDEEEEHGSKISSNTLVLSRVFNHLSVSEVLKCRLVNKLWNLEALVNLGPKTVITINKDNIQRLNQTAEKTRSPFCRQFILHMLDLGDGGGLLPWFKVFKNYISYLSLEDCCTTTNNSSKVIIARLLKAPNVRELKITGGLGLLSLEELSGNHHHRGHQILSRLSKLELCSSLAEEENHCGGQISREFMEILLRNSAKTLQSISIIGNGIENQFTLWSDFVHLAPNVNLKINQLKLCNLRAPLEIPDFDFLQKLRIRCISFHNCIVWRDVLQNVLEMNGNYLKSFCILGPQHEILTNSFNNNGLLLLRQLTKLTLPIDGVGTEDGTSIMQALPNLEQFNVVGLFQTDFNICKSALISMTVNGPPCPRRRHPFSQSENQTLELDLVKEKRREFLKLILIFLPQQPRKLKINLVELDSPCLRRVYQLFPNLEELKVTNNSRNCLDGWSGIPIKTCRKLSACKSFGVAKGNIVQSLCSVSSLKKLKHLEIGILGDAPKSEFTLIYILYGICKLEQLEELRLDNFTISDVAFAALSKSLLRLKYCHVNGSSEPWTQFKIQNNKVKSFLLPPARPEHYLASDPLKNSKIMNKIFTLLPRRTVFNVRLVSRFWHSSSIGFLHSKCDTESRNLLDIDKYLLEESSNGKAQQRSQQSQVPPSLNKTPRHILTTTGVQQSCSGSFSKALEILRNTPTLSNLVIRGMNKSMLEYHQRENGHKQMERFSKSCQDRRKIIYWFYPDGFDDLDLIDTTTAGEENPEPTSLILIGSWGKKDTGLLEFLDTAAFRSTNNNMISSLVLHGLIQEVFDLILPRVGAMRNLESLAILPFSSSSVTEISRNHLQILSNASFALKHLVMHKLQAPSAEIASFIRSCRFTLTSLDIQNNVNVSDYLSFNIPNLSKLRLDEPPGIGLWTTLNINQSVETVQFERSGYIYNQIKSKALPKQELTDPQQHFEHCATNILCDVNLFLEWAVSNKRPAGGGAQKSILQEGSDSAIKFFSHFRFLTSLTLRSVHGHFGTLQGIFRNFPLLEKLVFTNTTGITDEILTGIPKYLLDRIDLMNPLNFKKTELHDVFSNPSIRNLKRLTYLSLDDQVSCTDLSIIFGIMTLKHLEYFSCKKWKITDASIRAITDMTSVKHIATEGCPGVSSYGLEYFNSKTLHRIGS